MYYLRVGPPAVEKQSISKEEFVDMVYERAKADEPKTKIPAVVMTAQACLESDYGRSPIAVGNNNIFGMRRFSGEFKSYDSWEASVIGYESCLTEVSAYSELFSLKTNKEWIFAIGEAGYCPEPDYGDRLWSVVEQWDLEGRE